MSYIIESLQPTRLMLVLFSFYKYKKLRHGEGSNLPKSIQLMDGGA